MISRIFHGINKRLKAYYMTHIMNKKTPELEFPMEDYEVNGDGFGVDCTFNGVHWGQHMGEDCNAREGTKVMAIGRGVVVYAGSHPGKPKKPNWGNIIVIAHRNPDTNKVFFSVYGHVYQLQVEVGDSVVKGDVIAEIAPPLTPENGWWEEPHLHLGIYVGPWRGNVLPGYYRKDQALTHPEYWRNPTEFIQAY